MKKILSLSIICIVLIITSCSTDDGPTCNDGIQNANETEIDCGGDCEACPSCIDGIQNGDETGVDCGGSCGPCYGVGLPGPSGGIIFYDKGELTDGWQYLVAAPEDLKYGGFWDCQGVSTLARAEGLGEGDQNLEKVKKFSCFAMSTNLQVAPMMLQANNYKVNGYTDWYLPTINEMRELYNHRDFINGLQESKYYSSTEAPNQLIKAFSFIDGTEKLISKQDGFSRARAIRKF